MTTAGPGDEATASEIFLVAAEASGDRLGVALMRALRERAGRPLRFCGVGGREMTAAGFENLHPWTILPLSVSARSRAGCREF